MRWIVGIDFKGRCGGTLQMAAWMREHARPSVPQAFVGVHVLDERLHRVMVKEATVDLPPMAADTVRRLVAESALDEPLTEIRADWAGSPEEGLALAAAHPDVTGILIGRAAGVAATSLRRLGRSARRLLRRLPAPVMVIPPDLKRAEIGAGPIILATALDATSVTAARTARELAVALGRDLLVVHVDDTFYEIPVIAPEAIIPWTTTPRRAVGEVVEWSRANELGSAHVHLVEGERITTLLQVARDRDAPLIVCGSRRLTLGERLFTSSTGSELARMADRPVLVVPA